MKRQVTITSMFNKTGKADHEESICESAESKKQRYDSNDTDSEISGSDSSEDLDFEEFEGETVQIGETGEFMMQGKVHVHVTAAVILHMFSDTESTITDSCGQSTISQLCQAESDQIIDISLSKYDQPVQQ